MRVELALTLGALIAVFGTLMPDVLSADTVLLGGLLQVLLWLVILITAPLVWPL